MKQNKPYTGLALLTDLDGTLLTTDKKVTPQDAAALADFREKGGLFSIATGRGLTATEPFLDMLKPDNPFVIYNGTTLYSTEKQCAVHEEYLPHGISELLTELMEAFPEAGAEVLNQNGTFVIQDGEYERRHLALTHVPMVFRKLQELNPERCYKALLAAAPEVISRMAEYLQQESFSIIHFTKSADTLMEILPKGISKGSALEQLRGFLPPHTILGATGDFDNDLEMLRKADFCGCPANAEPCVKEAVRKLGGFCSEKSSDDGFFAEWIAWFLAQTK